jgi:tectonic-1/3
MNAFRIVATTATTVLLVLLLLDTVAALSPVSTVVDWSAVPATAPDARNLNSASLGSCICDVTINVCDINCCCDTDCTSAEVLLFGTNCLPATVSGPEVDDCVSLNSATELIRINEWGGTLDQVKPAKGAVCLERNNYPDGADSYFQVPSTVTKPTDALLSPDWYSPDVSSTGFVVGQRLPMVRFSNVTGTPRLLSVGSGYLSVPSGSPSGECQVNGAYEKPVQFFSPLTASGCKASGTSSAACDFISLSRFATQDALANPTATVTTGTTLIAITTRVFSASTGAFLYTIDNLPLRQTFFTLSSATAVTANTTLTPLTTSFNATSNTCTNGVSSVRTTVLYDVTATVVVRNVTRDIYVGDIDVSPDNGGHTFSHDVYMLRSGSTATPSYNEGSPGYIAGTSMRAGSMVSEPSTGKVAVQERVGGFAVPTGGKACSRNLYKSVAFMHNVLSSGCTLTLTELELQTLCSSTAGGTSSLLTQILSINGTSLGDGELLNTTTTPITLIAKTADAQHIDPSSWVSITGFPITSPTPNPYDDIGRQCSNLVVGLSYSFVVARAGRESNPQDVIVGAFVDPIIGSWRIRNETDETTAATSTVSFTFRVKFERYLPNSQTTLSRRIVAPPILPDIDDTVFYPFRMP